MLIKRPEDKSFPKINIQIPGYGRIIDFRVVKVCRFKNLNWLGAKKLVFGQPPISFLN